MFFRPQKRGSQMTAFVNCEELPQGWFRKRSKKMKIEATSFKEK